MSTLHIIALIYLLGWLSAWFFVYRSWCRELIAEHGGKQNVPFDDLLGVTFGSYILTGFFWWGFWFLVVRDVIRFRRWRNPSDYAGIR